MYFQQLNFRHNLFGWLLIYLVFTSSTSLALSIPTSGTVTIYVSSTGTNNDASSATSWASATNNLQAAVDYASLIGGEVWVARGLYRPTDLYGSADISFSMKNGVAIFGGFNGTETQRSQRPVINLTAPSTTTLSGNIGQVDLATDNTLNVIKNGPGLTSTAILDGFVISDGRGVWGGGMANEANGAGQICSPLIRNCLFINNSGSGLCNRAFAGGICSPVIENCSFIKNTSQEGGGMYNAAAGGGAICNPVITNCLFARNSASSNSGGGMSIQTLPFGMCNPVLTNCAFQSNIAYGKGGAISVMAQIQTTCNPTFVNCSFHRNVAKSQGGAFNTLIYGIAGPTESPETAQSTILLTNCIFWGNGNIEEILWSGSDGGNTIARETRYGRVIARYSLFDATVTGYTNDVGNKTTTISPFASLNSTQLTTNSPAINAGDPSSTTASVGTTDLTGNLRIVGNRIDMGAYEQQQEGVSINGQPASSSVVCDGQAVSVSVSSTATGYSWYKDGLLLPDFRSPVLSIPSVTTADAGTYLAIVTNGVTSATSSSFSLTVHSTDIGPLIVAVSGLISPQHATVIISASATNAKSYSISGPATQTSNNLGSFSVSQPGTYAIIASASETSECFRSTSVEVRQAHSAAINNYVSTVPFSTSVSSLTALATGIAFKFTGPSGYVFSNVYRVGGQYIAYANDIFQPGYYTLTVYGEDGTQMSVVISVIEPAKRISWSPSG